MLARELAELLLKHPDYEVMIEHPQTIEGVSKVTIDCFDADEGMVFVIEAEDDDA